MCRYYRPQHVCARRTMTHSFHLPFYIQPLYGVDVGISLQHVSSLYQQPPADSRLGIETTLARVDIISGQSSYRDPGYHCACHVANTWTRRSLIPSICRQQLVRQKQETTRTMFNNLSFESHQGQVTLLVIEDAIPYIGRKIKPAQTPCEGQQRTHATATRNTLSIIWERGGKTTTTLAFFDPTCDINVVHA